MQNSRQGRAARIVEETGWKGAAVRIPARLASSCGLAMDRLSRRFLGGVPSGLWTRPGDAERLGPNIGLKDLHPGQRCFIMGNGPSLEQETLTLLKDEVIFTCNQGYRFARSQGLSPRYHAIVDEHFLSEDYAGLLADLKRLQDECGTVLLTGDAIADAFARAKLDLRLYQTRQFLISDRAIAPQGRLPDLTQAQFGFLSVIHMAIVFALYMGFRDIRLIGCDMDYFIDPGQPMRHAGGANAFGPPPLPVRQLFGWDQIEIMRWCLKEFEGFRDLDLLARAHGGRVVNAGRGGALNVLERLPLSPAGRKP